MNTHAYKRVFELMRFSEVVLNNNVGPPALAPRHARLWHRGAGWAALEVFVRVAVVSLGLDLGHVRPALSVVIVYVCFLAYKRSGLEKIIFVNHVRAGPKHQI